MKGTAVMIVENKVEADAIALFDGELTFSEFMYNINKYFNRAKEMEKQQIGKAFFEGRIKEIGSGVLFDMQPLIETFDNYYNETFKSE